MSAKRRIRVAAIIVAADQVLLVSTRGGAPGYLVPPGGTVEAGESLLEALAREGREEADLDLLVGPLLACRELRIAGEMVLEVYFAATLRDGAAVPPGPSPEERRVVWVPVADLPGVPHFPDELAALCRRAAAGEGAGVYLGTTEI